MAEHKGMSGYEGGQPDVAWWFEQIRWGLEWRKKRAFEDRWPFWAKYYRGEWKENILPDNVFFRMLRTQVPKIYFRNPSVSIIATKPGVENYILSQIMETVDNQMIRQMNIKKQMKSMVQGAWMRGTGIGKLGFGSQYDVKPNEGGETREPILKGKERLEYDSNVIPNMPWFKATHTRNYVVPWGTTDSDDIRWDCFIISRPLEDVKKDPRFRTPKDMVVGDRRSVDPSTHELPGDKDHHSIIETADLFEIRDRKTKKVFVITPTHDKALLMQDDIYSELGIDPAYHLIFNEDEEGFWGVPDSQILEPLQLEKNDIKTYIMYHRRLSLIKMAVEKGSLDPEEIEKVLNGDVMSVIQTNTNPKDSMHIFQAAQIPDDLFIADKNLEESIRDTMGFSRNQSGEFKPGSKSPTAREVQEVSEAANLRTDERRDMVADLLVKLIQDINPIIFRNWTEKQVTRVIGPGGVPLWVEFQPKMLERGHYSFNVDPDTSLPETKALREAKAIQMYEVLKPNPLINPLDLTRYLLHEMHGVAFDSMMRGLPAGAGLQQEKPLSIGQFGQVINQVQQSNPQLLNKPGGR